MKKTSKQTKNFKKAGVEFDLEENAEELFLQSLENIDPQAIPHTTPPGEPISAQRGKKQKAPKKSLDLHGMTVAQAQEAVKDFFSGVLVGGLETEITVITGKGRHSEGGQGTLVHEIHRFVTREYRDYIVKIDSSPGDLLLEGFPIRGHFDVTLKPKKL